VAAETRADCLIEYLMIFSDLEVKTTNPFIIRLAWIPRVDLPMGLWSDTGLAQPITGRVSAKAHPPASISLSCWRTNQPLVPALAQAFPISRSDFTTSRKSFATSQRLHRSGWKSGYRAHWRSGSRSWYLAIGWT